MTDQQKEQHRAVVQDFADFTGFTQILVELSDGGRSGMSQSLIDLYPDDRRTIIETIKPRAKVQQGYPAWSKK